MYCKVFFVFLFFKFNPTYTLYDADVNEINSSNFNNYITKEKFSFIYFFSSWKESCNNNIKLIESLKVNFKDRNDIVIGRIDIYENRKIASKYHIEDYCSIKYFIKGSLVPENYSGKFRAEDLIDFINRASEIEIKEEIFTTSLFQLTSDNFDRIVKDKSKVSFVFFYTKWCKKCEELLKTIKSVARTFKNEHHCVIGKINGEEEYDITIQNGVGVYPTFKFFPKNNKDGETYYPGKFDENWSERNITKFLNVHCETRRQEGGMFDKTAGRINHFDVQAKLYIRNHNKRKDVMTETLHMIESLPPYKRKMADYYLKVMKRVDENGEDYIDNEITRLDKLLLAEVLETMRDELNKKKNILEQFLFQTHDEL